MSGSHTPGPWTTQRSPHLQDGQYDFAVHGTKAKVIAEAFGRDTNGNIINADANSRLIAAAPDLLGALKGAVGALEFSRDYHRDLGNEEQAFAQDKLDAALKAIAKAEAKS